MDRDTILTSRRAAVSTLPAWYMKLVSPVGADSFQLFRKEAVAQSFRPENLGSFMKPMDEDPTFPGVGLLGGSVGLALRERKLVKRVIGVGRPSSEPKLRDAIVLGAIDNFSLDLAAGVAESDLVIICTPVDTVAQQVIHIAKACRAGTLITDVGSTKAGIVQAVEAKLPANVEIVTHEILREHQVVIDQKEGAESRARERHRHLAAQ